MHTALIVLALIASSFAEFSSTAQQQIVDAHNNLRSQIAKGTYVAKGTKQQPGADILKMKWDESIATSAQNYTNGCPKCFSHAPGLGENLYWFWISENDRDLDSLGVSASNVWEKEFQDNGWTSNIFDKATFNTGIRDATQMVWSKTGALGCGIKNCGADPSMNNLNRVVVVCQYKAQGNSMDQPIYKQGATCSACPSPTKCETSSGLCV